MLNIPVSYKTGLIVLLVFCHFFGAAQVKIGSNPDKIHMSSILELESQNKGLLLSRLVDTSLVNSLNPPDGMLVFYNGENGKCLLVRKNNRWVEAITSDALSGYISSVAQNLSSRHPVITVVNGAGSMLQAAVIDLNLEELGHVFKTPPVKDSIMDLIYAAAFTKTENGLSRTGTMIHLGGDLTRPTVLGTSKVNTFSIQGLQEGNIGVDSSMVVEAGTGVIKKIISGSTVLKKVVYAIDGQTRFVTPSVITQPDRITLFRNGIQIDFTKINDTTIQVETGIICDAFDEIKIFQYL